MPASPLIDPDDYLPAVERYLEYLDALEEAIQDEMRLRFYLAMRDALEGAMPDDPDLAVIFGSVMHDFDEKVGENGRVQAALEATIRVLDLKSKMILAADKHGLPSEPFVEMELHRTIKSIGPARKVAKRLLELLGGGNPEKEERIGEILQAMLSLHALDRARRTTAAKIGDKLGDDGESLKKLVVEGTRRGWIETERGRVGGCWLSRGGKAKAEEL